MKIIDRYIGKSTLIATLFGVVVLSFVLVLGNIFKELLDLLVNRNVPLATVLAFMMFVLPFSLAFTIPWGFLTALLLIFGRISADNELIALRANGVSISRVSIPMFCLAGILTVVCFWINADVAPRAEKKMLRSIFELATNKPEELFSADEVVTDFPDRRVYVGDRRGDKLFNIVLFEIDREYHPTKMVYAKEGKITSDPANQRLLLKLYDAQFEERDSRNPTNLTKIRQGIHLAEGTFPIALQELYSKYMNTGRLTSLSMNELQKEIVKNPERSLRVHVEINRRFSISLACLAFTLIAIPLGITAHRKETSVGFALSIALAFAYFFFILLARSLQENPDAHPVLLVWMPNVLFIVLGLFLFFRMARR